MTPTEINKRLAKLLGICWHEDITCYACDPVVRLCSCGAVGWPEPCRNPDFCADPRLVLRVMVENPKWMVQFNELPNCLLLIASMLDKTGKLALKAISFMEEKKCE